MIRRVQNGGQNLVATGVSGEPPRARGGTDWDAGGADWYAADMDGARGYAWDAGDAGWCAGDSDWYAGMLVGCVGVGWGAYTLVSDSLGLEGG